MGENPKLFCEKRGAWETRTRFAFSAVPGCRITGTPHFPVFFKACVCGGGFVQGSSRIILRTFYEPGQRDIWRASSLRPRAGQGAILKPLQSGHRLTLWRGTKHCKMEHWFLNLKLYVFSQKRKEIALLEDKDRTTPQAPQLYTDISCSQTKMPEPSALTCAAGSAHALWGYLMGTKDQSSFPCCQPSLPVSLQATLHC